MKKDTVVALRRPALGQNLLSTMLRDGAQRLVAQAVQGRGLTIPPRLAVGDGALGSGAAVREIYPETRARISRATECSR